MNSISLALFDMDDVLCHYDRSARVRSLAALSGRSDREVADAVWGSGLEARADAGALTDDAYLLETGKLLGCEVTQARWLEARKAAMSPDHEVLRLAKAASRYCRIAVLTNNPQLLAANIDYLCPEIAHVFGEHVYASASFGSAKPDVDVFRRCLHQLGVAPNETFFVDDLPTNVEGACLAGLDGFHYTGREALRAALTSRGMPARAAD